MFFGGALLMIYFDNAATQGKRPECVFRGVREGLSAAGNPNRTAGNNTKAAALRINETREALCEYMGIKGTAALVSGCTEALNLAILGSSGGPVVTTAAEHNSVLRPLYALMKRGREVRFAETDETGKVKTDSFAELIKGAEMAVVTHVSNVTGGQNDLAELYSVASSEGALLIADCAQSAGHVPLNGFADAAAVAGHKGLYAPSGCGALVIKEGVSFSPLKYGGTGSDSENNEMPEFPPERYEAGTGNLPGIFALNEALKWLKTNEAALSEQRKRVQTVLFEGLSRIDGINIVSVPNKCGIVTFTVKENFDSAVWCEELFERYGIMCRGGIHCAPLMHKRLGTLKSGAVRFSVEASNTEREAEYVVRSVRELIKEGF